MQLINGYIINHILTSKEGKDAESIWLDIRATGLDISHSSFNNKLKKLWRPVSSKKSHSDITSTCIAQKLRAAKHRLKKLISATIQRE